MNCQTCGRYVDRNPGAMASHLTTHSPVCVCERPVLIAIGWGCHQCENCGRAIESELV